jgi:serine/threonine protein kinase
MGLQHKYIIRLYSAHVINTDICMVMEYADGGELVDSVREKDGLSELEARQIVK